MKKLSTLLGLTAMLLMMNSCTKEETIIQEYNPPQPSLYGTWKYISNNPSYVQYSVFTNDGNQVNYRLNEDEKGFRSKEGYPYTATDKQLMLSNQLFNYTVKNDTLTLVDNIYNKTQLVRVSNPGFTPASWLSTMTRSNFIPVPQQIAYISGKSIGIESDFLYMNGVDPASGWQPKVYKFNTLNGALVDSVTTGFSSYASLYFKTGSLYYGFEDYQPIYKGSFAPTTQVSNNAINYTQSLSMNPSSGVIYAFAGGARLMTGTENSTFSELYDFGAFGVYSMVYYKNDEFLCLKNGRIYRIKISPTFTIVAHYDILPGFGINTVSTNGQDVWVYAYDNSTYKYGVMKVQLN